LPKRVRRKILNAISLASQTPLLPSHDAILQQFA
jgi:hypothetical protein